MKLTVAELDFVLRDDARWPEVRAAWGFAPQPATEEGQAYGVTSLLARDLAKVVEGQYLLDSAVAQLGRRLTTPATVVQVAGLTGDEVTLATYLLAAGTRTMVLPVAPGVVAIDALRTDDSPAAQLAALVTGALQEREGGYVVRVGRDDGWVAVNAGRQGERWTCEGVESDSADDFSARLERALQDLPLPAPRPA